MNQMNVVYGLNFLGGFTSSGRHRRCFLGMAFTYRRILHSLNLLKRSELLEGIFMRWSMKRSQTVPQFVQGCILQMLGIFSFMVVSCGTKRIARFEQCSLLVKDISIVRKLFLLDNLALVLLITKGRMRSLPVLAVIRRIARAKQVLHDSCSLRLTQLREFLALSTTHAVTGNTTLAQSRTVAVVAVAVDVDVVGVKETSCETLQKTCTGKVSCREIHGKRRSKSGGESCERTRIEHEVRRWYTNCRRKIAAEERSVPELRVFHMFMRDEKEGVDEQLAARRFFSAVMHCALTVARSLCCLRSTLKFMTFVTGR